MEARWREGRTIPEISDEIGRSWSVVGRHLKSRGMSRPMGPPPKYEVVGRTCLRCGRPRVFKSPSDRGNREDGLCRECYEAGAVVNTCPVCGEQRHRSASHAHKLCCGYRHAAAWRWQKGRGIGLKNFVEAAGLWNGAAVRRWKLRWTRSPGRKRSYTDEQAAWVRTLASQSYGHDRIAGIVGVSRDTVRRIRGRQKRA
jgi:hypothetical protein